MQATHFMVLALLRGHATDDIFFGRELLLHFEQRAAFIERHDVTAVQPGTQSRWIGWRVGTEAALGGV